MEKRIVNIASYNRTESLIKTIESIIDQCDVINVSLNDFNGDLPSILYNNKINLFFTDNSKGDAFKFLQLMNSDGYYLTIDDDLIYPPDYVDFMIAKCKEYGDTKIITLHGRNFSNFPIQSYYGSAKDRFSCLHEVRRNEKVQFGGTGVMCFHTKLLKLPIDYFQYPNMADVWIGKYCMENNIDILCVRHHSGYIKYIHQKTTIFDTESKRDTLQTLVVNSIFDKAITLPDIVPYEGPKRGQDVFKEREVPIKIESTLEKRDQIINYEKVNQIFSGAKQPKVHHAPAQISQKASNNASVLHKMIQNRNRR